MGLIGLPRLQQRKPVRISENDAYLHFNSDVRDGMFVYPNLKEGVYKFQAALFDLQHFFAGGLWAPNVRLKLDLIAGNGTQILEQHEFMVEGETSLKYNMEIKEEQAGLHGARLTATFSSKSLMKSVHVKACLDFFAPAPEYRHVQNGIANARRMSHSLAKPDEYIVELTKDADGDGMVIGLDPVTGFVVIQSIAENGAAARTRKLNVGDRVKGVQGYQVDSIQFGQVMNVLRSVPITLVLLMSSADKVSSDEVICRPDGANPLPTPPRRNFQPSLSAKNFIPPKNQARVNPPFHAGTSARHAMSLPPSWARNNHPLTPHLSGGGRPSSKSDDGFEEKSQDVLNQRVPSPPIQQLKFQMSKDAKNVFVSYRGTISQSATKIVERLQSLKCPLFFAPNDLEQKSDIFPMIKASSCVLVILSPDFLHSKWCIAELVCAQYYNKVIIPCVIKNLGARFTTTVSQSIKRLKGKDLKFYIEDQTMTEASELVAHFLSMTEKIDATKAVMKAIDQLDNIICEEVHFNPANEPSIPHKLISRIDKNY